MINFIDPDIINRGNIIDKQFHLSQRHLYELWVDGMLFKWHWWLELLLTILPWIVWILVRKKNSTSRLIYAGLFVILISCLLDIIGVQLDLWNYNSFLLPINPAFIPWDISLLPVSVMLFIQFKPNLNPIIKAIAFSIICSFIVEPFFVFLQIYNPVHWKHYYSFPIFIIIYLIADYLSKRQNFENLE